MPRKKNNRNNSSSRLGTRASRKYLDHLVDDGCRIINLRNSTGISFVTMEVPHDIDVSKISSGEKMKLVPQPANLAIRKGRQSSRTVTALTRKTLPKKNHIQLSSYPDVHEAIMALCPHLEFLTEGQKHTVAALVDEFVGKRRSIAKFLAELANDDVVDFLKGTTILAKRHTKGSIPELFQHLEKEAELSFNKL